jgi:diguanylate cyclase (GGDEF)-like protein
MRVKTKKKLATDSFIAMRKWLFLILVLATQPCVANTFDEQLSKADALKTSDLSAFEEILANLDANKKSLSAEQLLYFKYLLGFKVGFTGNAAGAIELYREAYKDTNNIQLKVNSLSAMINVFGISRDYSEAYRSVSEILALIPKANEQTRLAALVRLAIFYSQMGDYDLALYYAKPLLSQSLPARTKCFVSNIVADSYYRLSDPNFSQQIEQTLDSCYQLAEPAAKAMAIQSKAKYHLDNENYDQVATLLSESYNLAHESKYPRILSEHYFLNAQIQFIQGYNQYALENVQAALDYSQNLGNSLPRVESLRLISEIYEADGNLGRALEYYKLYAEAEKAFLDETKAKQLAIQQAKIESIEKTNQIALLDKENAVLKAEARAGKEEQLNAQLTAGMLALLALATLMWAYKNRRMHLILRHKAQTDQLTKIANRSHFSAESEQLLKQRKLVKTPVAFIIFDLDFFKQVNDNHGHIVGDWVLTNAVQAVKPLLRATDKFGRMGGEEFAIMLAGCDAQQAMAVAEDCRQAIEAMDCSPSGAAFNVTASFGVADSTQCGYNFDKLYGCADEALYQSKHAGRNRVYLYHPSTQQSAQTLVHA